MFALKVFVLLGLACTVYGTDYETGLGIMKCAQAAIAQGVPELGVPTHEPFVVIKHNFSWHGDIKLAKVDIDVHGMTWAGLPHWDLSAYQTSKDTDDVASFDFTLYWSKLQINGSFDVDAREIFLEQEYNGTFSVTIEKTKWAGSISADKSKPNVTIADAQIQWTAEDVHVELTGLGVLDTPTAATLATTIKTTLNSGVLKNKVGEFVLMRLNTIWFPTGKIWLLTDWCKANNILPSF